MTKELFKRKLVEELTFQEILDRYKQEFSDPTIVGGVIRDSEVRIRDTQGNSYLDIQNRPDGGKSVTIGTDVTISGLQTGSVLDGQFLEDLSVAEGKVAAAAITVSKLGDYAVQENKLYTGAVTANKIASNAVTTAKLNAGAVTSAKIQANTIVAGDIAAGTITASEIAADTITAAKLNVSTLSSISANIGTVTSGTITGATIQTSSSANTGVKMTTAGGLDLYGQSCEFRDTNGNLRGKVWGYTGGHLRISSDGIVQLEGTQINIASDLFPVATSGTRSLGGISCEWGYFYSKNMKCSGYLYLNGTAKVATDLIPLDSSKNLGSSSYEWGDGFFDGTVQTDALRIDQTPATGTITPDKTVTINFNGTDYKIAVKAA